jgi:hypothetical protein
MPESGVQRSFGVQRAFGGDILDRLKKTQCCDVVIDSLLGGAIEEIVKLRIRNRELLKISSEPRTPLAVVILAAIST